MKKRLLLILIVCIMLFFSACSGGEPISTELGEFNYEQEFMSQIDEETAASGNTYLVIYLTPAQGTVLDLDEAEDYFFGGTKAELSDKTYDMSFMVFEKIDGDYVRLGLVFEVVDNDYANAKEQPTVKLILP